MPTLEEEKKKRILPELAVENTAKARIFGPSTDPKLPGTRFLEDTPGRIKEAYDRGGIGGAAGAALGTVPAVPIAMASDMYDGAKAALTSSPVRAVGRGLANMAGQAFTGEPIFDRRSANTKSSVSSPVNATTAPFLADPRFEAMRIGKQNIRNATIDEAIAPFIAQKIATRLPEIGNREAMGAVGGTIRDEQTGETISMGANGVIHRFDANGKLIDKLSERNWGRPTNLQSLAGRKEGQSVNYSKGGLDVQFAGDTPTNEIQAFTGTHSSLADKREADNKVAAAELKALQAMNGGRGPGPDMPTMPDVSGMTVNRQKAAIGAYQAKQTAYDNWHQNANQAEQNSISREQNRIAGEGNKSTRLREMASTDSEISYRDAQTKALQNPPPVKMSVSDGMGGTNEILVDPRSGKEIGVEQKKPQVNIPPEAWGDTTPDIQSAVTAGMTTEQVNAFNALPPKEQVNRTKAMVERWNKQFQDNRNSR